LGTVCWREEILRHSHGIERGEDLRQASRRLREDQVAVFKVSANVDFA
jgi:hypothetical protein